MTDSPCQHEKQIARGAVNYSSRRQKLWHLKRTLVHERISTSKDSCRVWTAQYSRNRRASFSSSAMSTGSATGAMHKLHAYGSRNRGSPAGRKLVSRHSHQLRLHRPEKPLGQLGTALGTYLSTFRVMRTIASYRVVPRGP